jgi:hypothetical protein
MNQWLNRRYFTAPLGHRTRNAWLRRSLPSSSARKIMFHVRSDDGLFLSVVESAALSRETDWPWCKRERECREPSRPRRRWTERGRLPDRPHPRPAAAPGVRAVGSARTSAYSPASLSMPLRCDHLDSSSATASLLRSARAMCVLPRRPASGSSKTSQSPP